MCSVRIGDPGCDCYYNLNINNRAVWDAVIIYFLDSGYFAFALSLSVSLAHPPQR